MVNGQSTNQTGCGGRRPVVLFMLAPDDEYFKASDVVKAARQALSSDELRRGARAPWRAIRTSAAGAGGPALFAAPAVAPTAPAPAPRLRLEDDLD